METEEVSTLFRVRRTVHEMMRDRGYLVDESELNMTRDEFVDLFGKPPKRDEMTIYLQHRDDESDFIFIFFPDDKIVGVKPIRVITERMKVQNVKRATIVVKEKLTPRARQALVEVSSVYSLEVFKETELLINITKHELVPTHIPLSEEEKQALLKQYKLRESQLPRIQLKDPISRYYGLQRGTVVKIIRASETAGKHATYRLVV